MERIAHQLQQGSASWHAFRAEHFGASEASAMLGLSPYATRSDLLKQKATGTEQEVSPQLQAVFDRGHETEVGGRLLAEAILAEDLFPVVMSMGKLSASCDGLTMDESTAFEHKQWSEALAESIANGVLPEHHQPQCQQVMHVTGATRCLFMTSDGTDSKCAWMWVERDAEWIERIVAGWALFGSDLRNHEHVEVIPAAIAAPVKDLPAVIYKLNGTALTSNLADYKVRALELVEDSKRPMESDQDFADRIELCKKFGEAEKKIELMQAQVVGEITDVNAFCTDLGEISKMFRQARLAGEKLVEAEKTNRRNGIMTGAKAKWLEHVAGLNKRLGKPYMPDIPADFAGAMKGLKSLSSMQNACDTLLANAKLAANDACDKIDANLKTLRELAADYAFLFADTPQLIGKANDDLTAVIKSRIADHVEAKRKEEEALRERVAKEEREKAEREATVKLEAERKDDRDRAAAAAFEAAKIPATQTDQATVSQNGASSPPEFPAVLSPAEAVAPEPAPAAVGAAAGAASVARDQLRGEIEESLFGLSLSELQQVAHFIDRLQSLRKAA